MRHLISILILCFPLIMFAEYNGVHIEFEILLNNGNKINGYKYLAHGKNTEEFKKHLEKNPEIYLKNQNTFEPGAYGYYRKRLKYNYRESSIFKLIEPIEINLNEINTIIIKELIIASYAIQIIGDYKWDDRLWINSNPIVKYSEDEDMCSYDTYIHKFGAVSIEVIEQIKLIIQHTDIKIKTREKAIENIINSDQEYQEQMQDLYNERSLLLKSFFEKHRNLKTITVGMCTC